MNAPIDKSGLPPAGSEPSRYEPSHYALAQMRALNDLRSRCSTVEAGLDISEPLRETPVTPPADDPINHPKHYTHLPCGVEVIEIARHLNFALGSAIKYILRCEHKGNALQDLKKARWFLDDEIKRRESAL